MVIKRLREIAQTAKDSLVQAAAMRRVAHDTGMVEAASLAGLRAIVSNRGRANPSTMFRYHAANTPHRLAIVDHERSYCFFEVDEQIEAAARSMLQRGVCRGDKVLIMLHNRAQFLFVQAACGRLGAAAVSVASQSTSAELGYIIEHAKARALFFEASAVAVVREAMAASKHDIGPRAITVGDTLDDFDDYAQFLCDGHDAPAVDDSSGEGTVVVYTSGTTGKPKGAVRKFSASSVSQIVHFIERTPMQVGQTHLTVCPLYHSTAFGFTSLSFLLASTVVLLERFEPQAFLDAIERHRVVHTAIVPTMLHRVLELGEDAIAARDLSSLQAIICGGAPLSPRLAERARQAFGAKLFNFYGSTETGLVTVATPGDLEAAPGTVGLAIPGNELRLLDDEGRPCPPGEVGELYVRSGNLIDGYHADDAATQASMRDGFFSVGDLARQDERGFWFIEGRKRDMIISGGVNVYPIEVETTLLACDAIAEAAVIGAADDEWGERVCAFVVVREPGAIDEAGVLAHCRDTLAGPKRPREVHFIDVMPRNQTGKVLKRELRARLSEC
jgi:fatty-acyl-CoA synthase